ncbi:hypothetical protein CBR_g38349 [Chara braunii]|uniref:Integrase catalytic domain-containing protein n=1 Tax=Chara braunii TaxID=69332 RepID=A0A388LPW9_CHABU|nr:hypothetical protein CBR_g38349 [Chara braunii]|eukprot:GBG84376.1 hypothetical protein CBR_g38349 [Chara braunii]
MTFRPPSRTGRAPHAVRTRAKGPMSPEEPAKDVPEPSGEKEVVDVPEGEDDEDDRLRKEEDERAEQRAKKRGARPDTDKAQEVKKKKYAVRAEEGFDVEEIMDRILEGHNHLMNLKDVLASAPILRDELRARLSRKMVASIRLGTIIPKEAEWAETGTKMDWKSVACGCLDVVVKGKTCTTMVDSDAEMNLIKEADAVRLGMEMREKAETGPCRINPETENTLIVGEPGFLTPQEEKLVVEAIRGRHATYAFSDDERGRLDVDIIPMIRIRTVPHKPWNLRGARYPNPVDEEKVVNYLDGKIRTHVADYSSGPYASPWFCFVKPNRTLRWVQDLQHLNAATVRDAGGLPNADALSEACAGRAIISLIDLYSGYDQFPVYPSDRPMTAMHTPRGLIHMNVAPQGWTNAVAMVQRHMVRAMQPISPHITQPYIDDLAVKGPKEKDEQEVMPRIRRFVWDHVQDLCKVLDLLKEHNLTASGPKSRHCRSGATILGFVCNERGRRPDTKKTNKILEWPTPFQTITENFAPSDPTIARWLTYIWMFDFELERIPGTKNRADGLSRVDWDKNHQGVIEDTPPVDGFLDSEEDVRLHINSWALAVGKYVTPGRPVWLVPPGHVRRPDLVLKPYIEEDSWGMSGVGWMMELAFAGKYELQEDPLIIENGPLQVGKHEKMIGGVYLLANALLQEETVRNTVLDQEEVVEPGGGDNVIHEREDDDFEEGEIKESFRAEEYEGVYLELGMLLSCEMRERDACARVLKMRPSFLVRDGHLFMRSKGGDPRRVVCGLARQIDIMAALHNGTAGGHRGADTTYLKIHELYYWDGMGQMIDEYCKSCVPCQERSALRPREPLHPRYVREVGAVVHLDLLAMSLGIGSYNFIFDARDNLSGFVDGRAIRTKTGETLARCIEEYYLRYPFVSRFVMDRGSEFTCAEVKALLKKYGVIAEHATFPIESFLKTWRRHDLETDLTFEELLDLRARQIGAIEDRIEEAGSRTADSRTKDKFRWDKMARVRKEPLKVGDVVLLYDSSLEKQWSRKLDKRWLGPYRVTRCGEHGAYQIEELNGTTWKDWVSGSRLKKFVARDEASERRGVEKKRREPETEARGTFEQGASPGAQREERRKEHKSHRHERAEGSDGSDAPPQPAQREMDGPMPDAEPDIPHEPHTQELREEPSVDEKELDREERAARELEIRTQLRKKNLAELHERMQQGKAPEEVEDRKGKGTCTQEEDPPLFSEVWMGFDKLMDATGRSGGQHQEMGVKLVSTDLLNLRSVMREGFAAARTSDQKIGDRLTKVAQEAYGQRVDWERKAGDPKRELDRQGKELAAVKADMERVSTENEVVRQVNQTLNKVTDALRAYLCAQITFFQVKETEWEKRIRDLEAKCAQQAPTRVMDWTEVQKFEIREQPVEEVFKREKEIEKADQQEGEEIPLIDKEMLEQPGVLVEKGAEVAEFEWRLPAGLTRGHEPAVPQEGPPVEAMRVEEAPPTIRKETVGQQEGQESVGQTMAETEQRVDLRDCQESIMLQEVPVVTDLRGVQGSWATSSGPSDGLVSS